MMESWSEFFYFSRDNVGQREERTYGSQMLFKYWLGFPGDSDGKVSACSAGDLGLIPGLERSPGEGNGNPLQDPSLENPMDRGAW